MMIPRAHLTVLLALALLPAPLTAAAVQEKNGSASERRSLEDLLDEIRRARSRTEAELRPRVAELMTAIDDSVTERRTAKIESLKADLIGLGKEALPLMVGYLDPGGVNSKSTLLRAQITMEVLHESPSIGVTDALIGTATAGSPAARDHALYALRSTPEPLRVLPHLIQIARSGASEAASGDETESFEREEQLEQAQKAFRARLASNTRRSCYRAIASLDVPAAREFLAAELSSGDPARQVLALGALGYGPVEAVAPQIAELLSSKAAPELAAPIAAFLRQNEGLLSFDEVAEAAVTMSLRPALDGDERAAMFDILRLSDAEVSSAAKRRLKKEFSEASRPDLRLAALQLLARNKDRAAKRKLLDSFDARLGGSGRIVFYAFCDRAELHHAIGDWNAAVKDWRAAMKLQKSLRIRTGQGREPVGIARALARLKKFREAADYLKGSPLSLKDLQQLASDRDFKEMAASRYGTVFKVD